MNRTFVGALLALVLAAPIIPLAQEESQGRNVKIVPRDGVVFGKTYGDWAAQWQQWTMAIPAAQHPLFDTKLEKRDCTVGQSGPVFFLGGTYTGDPQNPRECKVPSGKYIFFPIVNSEISVPEFGNVADLAAMRQFVADQIDHTQNLSAEIDGVPIRNVDQVRVQAPGFPFTLPAGDILSALGVPDLQPGVYFPGVDDGVYLMVEPLRPGKHTIRFHGEFPLFDFVVDVEYAIEVE